MLSSQLKLPFSPRETVICLAFYVFHGCSMHEVLLRNLSI